MALSNAERQKRRREKVKALLAAQPQPAESAPAAETAEFALAELWAVYKAAGEALARRVLSGPEDEYPDALDVVVVEEFRRKPMTVGALQEIMAHAGEKALVDIQERHYRERWLARPLPVQPPAPPPQPRPRRSRKAA